MLITSHLVATLLASTGLQLHGPELWTALAGGVAVDIDHVLVNTKWRSDVENVLSWRKITHGEVIQHSWIQEPVFGLFCGAVVGFLLSYFFSAVRWWVFPAFLMLHIFLDSLMRYEHQPFAPVSFLKYRGFIYPGSKTEWAISSCALAGVIIWLL